MKRLIIWAPAIAILALALVAAFMSGDAPIPANSAIYTASNHS